MRRRSIGAEVVDGGVHFRVWAPPRRSVAAVIDGRDHPLTAEPRGYFSGLVREARAGTRYRFRLDDEQETYPDPASRFQPEGVHGASEVVDPRFAWRHEAPPLGRDPIIYELHVGTFTREGTFAAASAQLEELADIGITMLEVMPIHDFPGEFGWGYDGVDLFAPTRLYGEPDDFRRFVDAAHAHNLHVILDVVYNHFGPDGCYLSQFTPHYFTKKYVNDWGEAINFDDDDAHGVREFFAENAAYWIDEFHLDGLRLDATQSIHDASKTHIIAEIAQRARAAAPHDIFIVAENEPQDARLIRELGLDAMWNDDWHHAARVALTGFNEAYYTDYHGRPQEFVSMAKHGFLYQGQRYKWQKDRRGTPSLDVAQKLVCFLENHDQVANSAHGERLHQLASPGVFRAMTALLLLAPQTPMLFQGQELGLTSPFLYFADHKPELAVLVEDGRKEFLAQFPSLVGAPVPSPADRATFDACKLDRTQRDARIEKLHRELLRLRRREPLLDGAVLGEQCFALRWRERLLIVNLGTNLHLDPVPEPLLAPPA
ncbi:MAG TPA: malto-oligosyltrehalose trehalohydrolase, partial [Thermoanaerobaculia bacterium]|nr:malto-oligosyltrehalose trehalohydrolase [Thermoanaerobaculia bacterium]